MSLLIIEMIFDSFLRILFEKESFFHWAFGGLEPDCYGTVEVASGRSALFIPRISEQNAIYYGELATPEQFSRKYGVDETYYTGEGTKPSGTKGNLRQEVRHLGEALKLNNYPDKLIRKCVGKCEHKIDNNSSDGDNNDIIINDGMHVKRVQDNDNTSIREYKSPVVLPYKEGTSEALLKILNKAGIKVAGIQTNKLN
ncbi:unnamed protein product [Trichobilharzia regenti]|nr:unnamed protein product [Trichobilharzia regenti]